MIKRHLGAFVGITALVWTGVLQSVVLVVGTLLCLATIVGRTPGGITHIVQLGVAADVPDDDDLAE